jgi:hypothetical protein
VIAAHGNGLYRFRTFLVGQRLYQVAISAAKDVAMSAEAESFFDSFQLRGE